MSRQEDRIVESVESVFGNIFKTPVKTEEQKKKEWLEQKYPGLFTSKK